MFYFLLNNLTTTAGAVMTPLHPTQSAHSNAACSSEFLRYPQKKSGRFELHLWQMDPDLKP